ncbi:MAG: hypothetical protein U9N35_01175 [Euryarchaeota archaeon]|nr:hypothetical protein [Euryarchaeota archaeon]
MNEKKFKEDFKKLELPDKFIDYFLITYNEKKQKWKKKLLKGKELKLPHITQIVWRIYRTIRDRYIEEIGESTAIIVFGYKDIEGKDKKLALEFSEDNLDYTMSQLEMAKQQLAFYKKEGIKDE